MGLYLVPGLVSLQVFGVWDLGLPCCTLWGHIVYNPSSSTVRFSGPASGSLLFLSAPLCLLMIFSLTTSYSFLVFGVSFSQSCRLGWLSVCAPRLSVKARSHCACGPNHGGGKGGRWSTGVLMAIWARDASKVSPAACVKAS